MTSFTSSAHMACQEITLTLWVIDYRSYMSTIGEDYKDIHKHALHSSTKVKSE